MLTESRLSKTWRPDGDTRRMTQDAHGETTRWTILGFRPQILGAVSAEIRGGTQWHWGVRVEMKISHEEHVAVGCIYLGLEYSVLGLSDLAQGIQEHLYECVIQQPESSSRPPRFIIYLCDFC